MRCDRLLSSDRQEASVKRDAKYESSTKYVEAGKFLLPLGSVWVGKSKANRLRRTSFCAALRCTALHCSQEQACGYDVSVGLDVGVVCVCVGVCLFSLYRSCRFPAHSMEDCYIRPAGLTGQED